MARVKAPTENARHGALSRLAKRSEKATAIGRPLALRLLARQMLIPEAAAELGVEHQVITKLLWRGHVWPYPETRRALAGFLDLSLREVESLLYESGSRRRRDWPAWVQVTCEYSQCGISFRKPRYLARRTRHHYCSPDHAAKAKKGHRRPPPLPAHGRRTGRHLTRVESIVREPSYAVIAGAAHLSESTVRLIITGHHPPTPFVRYCLERADALPRQQRPALADAVLDFCFTQCITLPDLARRAGVSAVTVENIANGHDARRATVAGLASAMGRSPADVEALCDPDRFRSPWRTAIRLYAVAIMARTERKGFQPETCSAPARKVIPDIESIVAETLKRHPGADANDLYRRLAEVASRRRGPGPPPTFTNAQAAEVRRLRDQKGLSWPEIGRRMGWPIQRDRHGRPSDCQKARRAYART